MAHFNLEPRSYHGTSLAGVKTKKEDMQAMFDLLAEGMCARSSSIQHVLILH